MMLEYIYSGEFFFSLLCFHCNKNPCYVCELRIFGHENIIKLVKTYLEAIETFLEVCLLKDKTMKIQIR